MFSGITNPYMKIIMTRTNPTLTLLSAFIFLLVSCTKDDIELNKVPVADAGESKTITLPAESATLTGTGTDSDGEIVAYLWSQVSGPGSTTIVNPGSPSTLIEGFMEGSYVFQLMVTDEDGATGVDTTRVTVVPPLIKTLTLQPSNNSLEFGVAVFNGTNQTGTGGLDIPLAAWTNGGLPVTIREVIKFDLSSIPANATIQSANLYLYSYPAPTLNGNFIDANFGTNNSMLVQQIVSNWTPANIGWFTQPATTTANQINIPTTTQSTLDLDLNVKNIVSAMVSANANYGLLLKLQNEVAYTSRIFVSSYNTTYPAKRPKLVVVYQ